MTLSRKAIRPFQTAFLLAHNVLPISIDYRLCPEINIIDGPIADVRDAYAWAQTDLQTVVRDKGILVDEKRIVMIGWSTGGHLAMTTAWTSKEAGLAPPVAILSFYGPTDFESGGGPSLVPIVAIFVSALYSCNS
jgi:acetyl esterase/lipase